MENADARDADSFSLFEGEEQVIQHSARMVVDLESVADGVRVLADAYRRSYREQRRLVRLSDRMQLELQRAKREQEEQGLRLAALNAQLTTEIQQRKALEAELRLAAITDSLTGVAVRRHFQQQLEDEIKRAGRSGRPLVLLLMDLDRFKDINDTHGHAAGDDVLVGFVKVCRDQLRETDLPGRIGGEEFAVILPECGPEDGQRVAERIRAGLEAHGTRLDTGETIACTVSIGLAVLEAGESATALMKRADMAMYAAKKGGRNRVVRHEAHHG